MNALDKAINTMDASARVNELNRLLDKAYKKMDSAKSVKELRDIFSPIKDRVEEMRKEIDREAEDISYLWRKAVSILMSQEKMRNR